MKDNQKTSLFKIEKNNVKKVKKKLKIFDLILILAIFFTIGIFVFFLTNNINFKSYKSNEVYYKIVFDSTGGSEISSTEVKEGYVELPTEIEREGFIFVGWMVDGELVDSKYYVEKNTSFKARWEEDIIVSDSDDPDFYSVIFNYNYDDEIHIEKVSYGGKLNKPEDPVREGYIFKGWYYRGNAFDFNTVVYNDFTLVAKWEKKKVTSNDKKNPDKDSKDETNQGNNNVSGSDSSNDSSNDSVIEDKIVTYNVTFDLDGGGNNYTVKVNSGQKVKEPSVPTRNGYNFKGWYYNDSVYNFNNAVNKDITIKAQWTKIVKYNVSFDPNSSKDPVIKEVVSGEKVSKPIDPTKVGYSFIGWYTKDRVKFDFNTKITKNIYLYALWGPSTAPNKTNVKWIYVNTPANLNSKDYLADYYEGNSLLYKTTLSAGTSEFFYTHKVSDPLKNNSYYAIRIYNPGFKAVTVSINACGVVSGVDTSVVWKSYYKNNCTLANKSYTILSLKTLVLYQSGNGFVAKMKNDQSNILSVNDYIEGVVNITTSGEVQISSLIFQNINFTLMAK